MNKPPAPCLPDGAAADQRSPGAPRPVAQGSCAPAPQPLEIAFETDAAGRWRSLGPAWTEVLGYEVREALGRPFLDHVHPDDRARHAMPTQPLVDAGPGARCAERPDCRRYETRYVARDGSVRWMEVYAQARLDAQGRVEGCAGILRDVTQRRRDDQRLRLAAHVFDGTSEGIVVTDPQARIVDVNEAFVAITGYAREQVLGRTPALLASGRHDAAFFRAMWDSLLHRGSWSGEIWNRRADGELVAEMLRISAVHAGCGERTHYIGIFSDITSQKRQQERLERLAHYDALTGLPNRVLVLDRLGQLMAAADRQRHQVAVCYLDLDGFMAVNEQFGHAQGDALLLAVAGRLRQVVRASDTVAHVGGDEFVLLLAGIDGVAAVHATLERVLESLAQPHGLGAQVLRVSASIGVALYPLHGATPDHLLRAADQAMYRAKRLGKGPACMAGDGVDRAPAQEALLEELRQALASGQLVLHFQPKVCAGSGRALGAEALVRWQHPQRGLLAPGAFLPAVLGTPLEVELDLWVVRAAVAQLARWRADGRELQLSINVSPGTLVLPDLADTVAAIVRGAGHAGAMAGIELEVLETGALEDLSAATRAIEACARHGISFALDDFGTGYSSLSYLRQLPVSTLKIDRSFVSHMLTDRGDLHIVRAVIGLAQAFGVTTVAEGVETPEHARALAELGCHQLQGYGIARPMPAVALEAWLDAREAQPRTPAPAAQTAAS